MQIQGPEVLGLAKQGLQELLGSEEQLEDLSREALRPLAAVQEPPRDLPSGT